MTHVLVTWVCSRELVDLETISVALHYPEAKNLGICCGSIPSRMVRIGDGRRGVRMATQDSIYLRIDVTLHRLCNNDRGAQ